jgi:hypothetical protein
MVTGVINARLKTALTGGPHLSVGKRKQKRKRKRERGPAAFLGSGIGPVGLPFSFFDSFLFYFLISSYLLHFGSKMIQTVNFSKIQHNHSKQ